jgi:site-specific DNA-methyltransferase (adenine-specific)
MSFASFNPCHQVKDATLINADCLDILPFIESKSVAAVIIDPPYGAQTHNQQDWDKMWSAEVWNVVVSQVFRILMPGGHFVVFASGNTVFEMRQRILDAYGRAKMAKSLSSYHMIWKHNSYDSGRVHSHTPRSQFEDILVFYRTGDGKIMASNGLLGDSYAFDQHVGRSNVLEFYKDDCRSKPFPTIQKYFKAEAAKGKHLSTFDYKPEALMRALIRDFSSPGHTIVDFCMRHGITAVASVLESRKFIGVELSKEYYERAKSRMVDQFGDVQIPRVAESPLSSPPTTRPCATSPFSASDEDAATMRLGSGLSSDDDEDLSTASVAIPAMTDSPLNPDPATPVPAATPAKSYSTYRCDKCDIEEICNFRFHMIGLDYDLCQNCFNDRDLSLDRNLFRRYTIKAASLLSTERTTIEKPRRASKRFVESPDTAMAKKPRGRPPQE